ncbi:MAG: hypothetical protein KME23_02390 [Goleter apudmare HA4340-LM2]|jgi:hypothetical protein|nr:hypothetical protein [Goleter apudmare HA4340-LM2]
MCHVLYLISECQLPTIKQDQRYPELTIEVVAEYSSPPNCIRKLIPQAKYLYHVHPTDLCGCYFQYESSVEREVEINDYIESLKYDQKRSQWFNKEYSNLRVFRQKQRLFWQECHNAVTAFSCYLRDHIHSGKLMLYMTWCGDEGKPIVEQQTITPEFFGGESCYPWKENALYTICTEAIA